MRNRGTELAALSGAFVVLDGGDGSGKTTLQGILAAELTQAGLSVVTCKDPGGTQIGNRIRSVLLDHDLTDMSASCETLLFMASRAQLVHEVVLPTLAAGGVVLCDRYVSSTCAYQGAIGPDRGKILELADYATGATWPDLTVVIDVPVEVCFERIRARNEVNASAAKTAGLDAMERRPLEFHERVRQNFLRLADDYPAPVCVVDGTPPVEEVARTILGELAAVGAADRGRSRGVARAVVAPA